MPIFTKQLRPLEYGDPEDALKEMAKHIKYIQEQLEYTLTNLDSSNVTEIETDITNITSSSGSVSFSGESISLAGNYGESFIAGKGTDNVFKFQLNGKNGTQIIYLDEAGNLIITKNASMSIDGGTW